jgi:hypothetical protein
VTVSVRSIDEANGQLKRACGGGLACQAVAALTLALSLFLKARVPARQWSKATTQMSGLLAGARYGGGVATCDIVWKR